MRSYQSVAMNALANALDELERPGRHLRVHNARPQPLHFVCMSMCVCVCERERERERVVFVR